MKPGKRRKRPSLKDRAIRIAEMVRKLAVDNLNYRGNEGSDGCLNTYKLLSLQEVANEVAHGCEKSSIPTSADGPVGGNEWDAVNYFLGI